ncbi:MAG: sigma-70 family RNA polymerase sigma factor, partial [Butyrivibrio sp.]|nr:sigma-70 family RNA polymerase sigma factor [Butyrivibrio sp.]
QRYASADAAGRVGLIYSNFATFLGTVDSRTDGLVYLIENEKALSRRKANGNLGVRVQTSTISDITGNTATGNVMTRDALVECDFSGGVLDGTERGDLFIKEAYLLQDMRRDYKLFVTQLYNLEEREREMLVCFMKRNKSLSQLADELSIEESSVRKRLSRSRKKLWGQMIDYMEGRV